MKACKVNFTHIKLPFCDCCSLGRQRWAACWTLHQIGGATAAIKGLGGDSASEKDKRPTKEERRARARIQWIFFLPLTHLTHLTHLTQLTPEYSCSLEQEGCRMTLYDCMHAISICSIPALCHGRSSRLKPRTCYLPLRMNSRWSGWVALEVQSSHITDSKRTHHLSSNLSWQGPDWFSAWLILALVVRTRLVDC